MMNGPSLKKPRLSIMDDIPEAINVELESLDPQGSELKDSVLSNLGAKIGLLTSFCNTILNKIDVLELLVKNIATNDSERHRCCDEVLLKLQNVENLIVSSIQCSSLADNKDDGSSGDSGSSPTVLVRCTKPRQVSAAVGLDSTLQVITLNCESDYPNGSWLGDENNPEIRVRCPISMSDLIHINTFCCTPEKMAVTLLDYLFTREVLAVSNLSGKGKHGKKQLDPLMIYGIRCHLMTKFNITEKDWHRIKQNMDSKCRTAWRKKVKGLPLGGFKDYHYDQTTLEHIIQGDAENLIITADSLVSDDSINELEAQVVHTPQGDIKVLHATPEQLARIQETHHIQVYTEDQMLEDHSQLLSDVHGALETSRGSESTILYGTGDETLTIVTADQTLPDELKIHTVEPQELSIDGIADDDDSPSDENYLKVEVD